MAKAAISIGSNIGDRQLTIRRAISALNRLPQTAVLSQSGLYETEPVDKTDQPWFINATALIVTWLEPKRLLGLLHRLEDDFGRERIEDKGPRSLDLDLLLYDEQIIDDPQLTVPHPRMSRRRFVLEPLNEIAPDMVDPLSGINIARLVARCDDSSEVRRLDPFLQTTRSDSK